MRTDKELQQDVLDELKWDPSVDASQIGVASKDGIVTLTGTTKNYYEKHAADRITKRVHGVRAVANDIEVKIAGVGSKSDGDIAAAALDALSWHTSVPDGAVKPTVSHGWIILEGEVDFNFQRESAYDSVKNLSGVRGVTNSIILKPSASERDVRRMIKAALHRSAEVDANHIEVEAIGGKIVLQGNVRSYFEREEAEKAAWMAPGVSIVQNEIRITSLEN